MRDCQHESVFRVRGLWQIRSAPYWKCAACDVEFQIAPTLSDVLRRARKSNGTTPPNTSGKTAPELSP